MKKNNDSQNFQFSFYKPPINNIIPEKKAVSLEQVHQIIKGPDLIEQTQKIRQEPDKDRRKEIKRSILPFVTVSGTFTERRNEALIKHSGLLCCDFDHLPDLEKAKVEILETLSPALLFRSPSGDGLKIIFVINLQDGTHEQYFAAIKCCFKNEFTLPIDEGKDVARACFLCHDPEVYYSTSPVVLDETFLGSYLYDERADLGLTPTPTPSKPSQGANEATVGGEVLYQRGKRWADTQGAFVEGQRHNYTTSLAGFLHRTGMAEDQALQNLEEYAQPGFEKKEIQGIVSRTYKNQIFKDIAPLETNVKRHYLSFPLHLLWAPKDQFITRINEILNESYDKTTREVPTSIKVEYLLDAVKGKLSPELLLLVAAVKSIIGKRNFTSTTKDFITSRMFGANPWRPITRHWIDKLMVEAMQRDLLYKVSGKKGSRYFYVSIGYTPAQISRAVMEMQKVKDDRIEQAALAGSEIASFYTTKKKKEEPSENNRFLKAVWSPITSAPLQQPLSKVSTP